MGGRACMGAWVASYARVMCHVPTSLGCLLLLCFSCFFFGVWGLERQPHIILHTFSGLFSGAPPGTPAPCLFSYNSFLYPKHHTKQRGPRKSIKVTHHPTLHRSPQRTQSEHRNQRTQQPPKQESKSKKLRWLWKSGILAGGCWKERNDHRVCVRERR